MKTIVLVLTLSMLLSTALSAAEWFVGPNGTARNAGTQNSPWDLQTALNHPASVKPGDTIWVLSGTYTTGAPYKFFVKLNAAAGKPIIVRNYRDGRATIDGYIHVEDKGVKHVWLQGLEITRSAQRSDGAAHTYKGLHVASGESCKYINLVIHDIEAGVGPKGNPGVKDFELYGCLLYNLGNAKNGMTGNALLYGWNQKGFTKIHDNIFEGSRTPLILKMYTTTPYAEGPSFELQGNSALNSGLYKGQNYLQTYGISGTIFRDNVLYGVAYRDIKMDTPNTQHTGNVIIRSSFTGKSHASNYTWNPSDPKPSKPKVVLRPNRYDANRAHLAIIDWSGGTKATASLSPFLKKGDTFKLLKATDYYASPVFEGKYNGTSASVPVNPGEHGEFNAYVVIKTGGQ